MKVLVAGGTGFIGRNVCEALARDGHKVRVLSRSPETARARATAAEAAHGWSPVSGPPPAEAVEWADAVVNLAGETVAGRWTRRKRRDIFDSRVKTTANIVSGIGRASARPKVLISASAVGYYGHRGEEEIIESAPPGEGFLCDLCASWEREALRAEDLGVRVVILRIGLVLGRAGGLLKSILPAARLGLIGPMGSGRQWWPWVHIEDVTGMTRFALGHEVAGPFNAVSPSPVRQKEFALTLAALLKRPALLRVPAFALELVGGAAADSLKSTRAVPYRARQAGYEHVHRQLAPALAAAAGLT